MRAAAPMGVVVVVHAYVRTKVNEGKAGEANRRPKKKAPVANVRVHVQDAEESPITAFEFDFGPDSVFLDLHQKEYRTRGEEQKARSDSCATTKQNGKPKRKNEEMNYEP